MLTQSQLDHLTDLSESIMAISSNLYSTLGVALNNVDQDDLNGLLPEDVLGQLIALKVLAKEVDFAILPSV